MFSLEFLQLTRDLEIDKVVTFFRAGARILEIGAGTGQQAQKLAERGFEVTAVEVPDSNYAQARVFPVIEYDGRSLPFDNASFDIVFSSNVLEHVLDLRQINSEIRRVLKPGGYAIHVLPTHNWRFWTTLSAFPDALLYAATLRSRLLPRSPSVAAVRQSLAAWWGVAKHLSRPFRQRRHGERGNIVSETWLFHPSWWRRAFRADGFESVHDCPMGLFYTGNMLLGTRLSMARRARLGATLGSACHLFEVRPTSQQGGDLPIYDTRRIAR